MADATAQAPFADPPSPDIFRWPTAILRGGPARQFFPFSRTRIRSAWVMVLSRCAITKLVLPFISVCRLPWMSRSDSVSRLLVASSRMRIRGSARIARAMVRRWRCPPDSFTPALANQRLVSISHLADEFVSVSGLRGPGDFRLRCAASAIGDVFGNRSIKQKVSCSTMPRSRR